MNETRINTLSDYLEVVQDICNSNKNTKTVFRGEQKIYESSAFPNLFRSSNQEHRNQNDEFELNILNKIRSEGFDEGKSYLLTAIEAQHGGFPSRLLDVSFNCLIALHFAITPHMTEEITKYDEDDGQVILIDVSRLISPASKELEKVYDNMIHSSNKSEMFNDPIYAYEHIIVDYYRKNRRIEAQQGGFILFLGKNFRPLPETIVKRVVIPKEAKESLRKELDQCFGINNSFVYPEISNYPVKAIESSKYYSNSNSCYAENILVNAKTNILKNISFLCERVRVDLLSLNKVYVPYKENEKKFEENGKKYKEKGKKYKDSKLEYKDSEMKYKEGKKKYEESSKRMLKYIKTVQNDLKYNTHKKCDVCKTCEVINGNDTLCFKNRLRIEINRMIDNEYNIINELSERLQISNKNQLGIEVKFQVRGR